ncbi:MAG: O-antigen ligase family protein [Ruminococcus sp.]|nr:O-antigen ligase family protein [Ruminococcus sp.]
MQISTRPITLLDIAKIAIYGLYLNYYCYRILFGRFIPNGTMIFFAIALACVIANMFTKKTNIGTEIKIWISYLILSLATSIFAINTSVALDGLNKYWQRLAVIAMIVYICEQEKTIKFAIKLLAATAITCASSCLIMNVDVSKKLELESGANISTNDIGSIMAFGCFAVLFAFGLKEHNSFIKTATKIGYILAAVSVIFIAGSRKSVLAILIMFTLIFLLCGRDIFKRLSAVQFVLVLLLIVGVIVFIYFYLLPNVESTDMYQRVWGRKAEGTVESDQSRIRLYSIAFKQFFDHPLVGLGFDNFRVYNSGAYSHSTYAEPLACSGIIGFLYLAPYVMILVKQIKLIRLYRDNIEERVWQKELLAFYISFLFVGIGIPYIYKDIPCIILGMFIASQKISFDRLITRATDTVAKGAFRESISNQGITNYS